MDRKSIVLGTGFMLAAVVLGAFGAHGLRKVLDVNELGQWNTGVSYQVYHAIGLLLIATFRPHLSEVTSSWVRRLFISGILLFSGSLYLLSTRDITGLDAVGVWVGPITPIGGLCFIAGWALLLINVLRGER